MYLKFLNTGIEAAELFLQQFECAGIRVSHFGLNVGQERPSLIKVVAAPLNVDGDNWNLPLCERNLLGKKFKRRQQARADAQLAATNKSKKSIRGNARKNMSAYTKPVCSRINYTSDRKVREHLGSENSARDMWDGSGMDRRCKRLTHNCKSED
eukprot:6179188-Pleurochrysis_carterae.AAC.2